MANNNKSTRKNKKRIFGIPVGWIAAIAIVGALGGTVAYAANNPVPGTRGSGLYRAANWVWERVGEWGNGIKSAIKGLNSGTYKDIGKQAHYYANKKNLSKDDKASIYSMAKQYGVNPDNYGSYRGVARAIANKWNKKSSSAKKTQHAAWNAATRMDRQNKLEGKVNDKYLSNFKSFTNSLPNSQAAKVRAYLKKHGDSLSDYETALKKYAKGKYAKKFADLDKNYKKDLEDTNQGDHKVTKKDAEKQLKNGTVKPTTLAGKIGQALLNIFWASGVGKWLETNGAGTQIFAGLSGDTGQALSSPMSVIYPAGTYYSKMTQISDILEPMMVAAGGALITLALVLSTMKMGWSQTTDPARARIEWYHNIIDTMIAVACVAGFVPFVNMILQVDGAILAGFKDVLSNIQPLDGSKGNLFTVVQQLGYDKKTINAITTGAALGSGEFAGIIFSIIYILASLGLTVYVKYFYFVRAITFTILFAIGPIFMSLWSFTYYGKSRTIAWLRDFLGTVFIQDIHALVVTFMGLFMSYNNEIITQGAVKNIVAQQNWVANNPSGAFWTGLPLIGGAFRGAVGAPTGSPDQFSRTFEGMVAGFIVIILFRPLSNSLASLFGISTNMLDNIHQSTSRTLKAGAMITGAAIGATAMGLGSAALKGGGGLLGAAGDALKKASKGAGSFKDFRKNLKKGFGKNFRNGLRKRKPFRTALAQANGIVGPNAGRVMGAAVGAGAGDPMAMMALSAAGGAIGERAARLANVPLKSLGLGQVGKVAGQITKNPDMATRANSKVNAANAKTKKGMEEQAKTIRDANNGHEAVDPNMANFEKQRNAINDALAAGKIDKVQANKELADINQAEANYKNIAEDADAQNMIAAADARKQASGSFSRADQLAKVVNEALGSEKSKMGGGSGQADKVQQSLALSGAATKGAVMSRLNGAALDKAAQNAKSTYAKEHAGEYARNGFASQQAWMDSSQYRQGEAAAMNVARKEAAMQSNGKVFSMPDQADNSQFGGSMVNRDTFKNEMAQSMEDAGVSQATQNKVLAAIEGVQGQSLINETPIEGANASLQTLNYGLSNKLGKQAAFSINNSGNAAPDATPVSAYDLAQVYKGDTNPATLIGGSPDSDFTADGFKDYMSSSENALRFQNVQRGLASAYADWQRDKAAVNNGFDMGTSGNSFGGSMGGFGGLFGGTPRRSPSTGFGGMTPNDYIAEQRIGDFYSTLGPSGISPQEAIDQLSSASPSVAVSDVQGQGGSGIAPGDLQLITTNEASYVRAKMGDGDYQLVGNYGAGDPALQGSESIIQNLDVSPDGTIGPRYDASTHRMEDPFSEIGNLRVPRAYTNGGPDLSSMLGGYASPEESNAVDMSDFNTMGQAKELERALDDQSTMTLDKLNDHYSDFSYYSDGDTGVIVGKDNRDGVYKQVSPVVEDSILGTHATGQQYRIPLTDSGNGLVPDSLGTPEIYSKNPISAQDKKQMLDTLKTKMDSTSERQEFNSYLNDLLNPTTRNLHNFIAKRPASQNIDGLDFAGK